MVSWASCNLARIFTTYEQVYSYLNVLFELLKEHLFVIFINVNLLAIINKIIVFECRQLFGLK